MNVARMSDAEVRAAFRQVERDHAHGAAAPRWPVGDLIQAHTDLVKIKAGERGALADVHPLAVALVAECGGSSLLDMARAVHPDRGATASDVLAYGSPGVAHLQEILSAAANSFVVARQSYLLAPIMRTTGAREVANFLPVKAATVELQTGIDAPSALMGVPWQTISPAASAEDMQLAKTAVRIVYSEQDVVNDDIGVLAEIVRAVATAAAQNELASWATLLNEPQVLTDGAPAFSLEAGNALDLAAAPSATTLSAAVAALRAQTVNRKPADLAPRILLVSGDQEIQARKTLNEIYGNPGPIDVVVSAYLSGDHWFLLADPAHWPVILRGTLAGDNGQSLVLSPNSPMASENVRNIVLGGPHAYAYAMVGRTGIVRLTAK